MSCLPDSTEVIEERFGDEYRTGVWSEFKEGVSSKIHDVVVALASFHGDFTVLCYLIFHICIQ